MRTICATLAELFEHRLTDQLGIRSEIYRKVSALGIDPLKTTAEVKSGMQATVFLLPEHKLVIRFHGNESEESTVTIPNHSRNMIQPYGTNDVHGNLLAILPLLTTSDVTQKHVEILRAGLRREGLRLWDDKTENIGTINGHPFVLDVDAVQALENTDQAIDEDRSEQWKLIDPRLAIDRFDLLQAERAGWRIDDAVRMAMSPTSPSNKAQQASGVAALPSSNSFLLD